jgi:hypothetical protein
MRSFRDIWPNVPGGANSPSESQERPISPRKVSTSAANSAGCVPPSCRPISGRVLKPCGQGRGVQCAHHLTTERLKGVEAELMYFSPSAARKESPKWQTIWWADILPQRGRSVARNFASRPSNSVRSRMLRRLLTRLNNSVVSCENRKIIFMRIVSRNTPRASCLDDLTPSPRAAYID